MYSFKGLYMQALRYFDESGDTTSSIRQLVKDAMNQAHQLRCTEYPWPFMLWPQEEPLTTTVGKQLYVLHPQYGRPLYFLNATTQNVVREIPERSLLSSGVNWLSDTGSAQHFYFSGQSAVAAQPTSASVITLVSTDPLDTGTDYQVVIKGIDSAGHLRAEAITPAGTTPVNSTSAYSLIIGVTKERSWNGVLTLTSNSGAVTNLVLDAFEYGKGYTQVFIAQSPTRAETLRYRFFRKPLQLVNDFDIPDIPYPYSQVLVFDALLLMASYNPDVKESDKMLWLNQQARWATALDQAFSEQQSLGALAQTTHDADMVGDGSIWRGLNT